MPKLTAKNVDGLKRARISFGDGDGDGEGLHLKVGFEGAIS